MAFTSVAASCSKTVPPNENVQERVIQDILQTAIEDSHMLIYYNRSIDRSRTLTSGTFSNMVRPKTMLRTDKRVLHIQARKHRHRITVPHLIHITPQLLPLLYQRTGTV